MIILKEKAGYFSEQSQRAWLIFHPTHKFSVKLVKRITIYTNRVFRIVALIVDTSRYEVELWTYAICADALHTRPFQVTGIVSALDPVYMGNVMFYACRVFTNSA